MLPVERMLPPSERHTDVPQASLIIPTLQRQELILEVLAKLETQSTQDFETIVIDQSETINEKARELAANSSGKIKYVYEERQSLPNARNIGAKNAASEVLIFIDDDVDLSKDFVESHLSHYGNSEIHAVAGRITGGYDDGDISAKTVGKFNPWTISVTRNFHVEFSVDAIDQLPGGNFSVRKNVYDKLSGFDAETFGGRASIGEETDFALRLQKTGKRICFDPKAHLIHLHAPRGGCREESKVRWTYWHGHNMGAISRRHAPAYTWLPFIWLQCGRYIAHSVKSLNPLLVVMGCVGTLIGMLKRP